MAKEQQTTEGINTWEFSSRHVQDNLIGHDFISAKSVLIAAGPPRKEDIGSNWNSLYPVGVVDNVGIGQNKGLQQLFEVGSNRSYFLPGRTVNSVTFGRVLFYGPSLLRVLYAYYPPDQMGAKSIHNVGQDGVLDDVDRTPQIYDPPGSSGGGEREYNTDFFMNLASDLFDKPLGLMLWMESGDSKPYGAIYLSNLYIQAHQFNVNANSVIIAEGVNAQFEKVNPVDLSGSFVQPTKSVKVPWPFS